MRMISILIVAAGISGLGLTAASAQNQPAPPPDAQHHDQMDQHREMHGDMHHDMHASMHRDMHHHWRGHRHCTWKWRHHHRVRVCW